MTCKPTTKLLRLMLFVGLSLLAQTTPAKILNLAQQNSAMPTTEMSVAHEVNLFRRQHSLPALKLSAAISDIATQHSTAMASHQTAFGHAGFPVRAQALYKEYTKARGVAENVAYADKDDLKPLVRQWFDSSGHRRNILGKYDLTGVGVARDSNGRVYVTQIFVLSHA